MKELEYIRKVENGVMRKIEAARKQSEKKISDMTRDRDRIVEERLQSVKLKLDKEAETNRIRADKEAADLLKASDAKIREIQKTAEKNFEKAVRMILGVLADDKS